MIKRINKTALIIASLLAGVFLILIWAKKTFFFYALAYLISFAVGMFVFNISDLVIKKIMSVKKEKALFILFNLLKLSLYALTMLLNYYIFNKDVFTFFFSFFGFLIYKAAILYLYLLRDPYLEKRRKVEKLNLSLCTIKKLKEKKINYTFELLKYSKAELLMFLNENETDEVMQSLAKLYLKEE